jgi:putative aldouronate transport system substrate-binding protein
MPWIRNSNRKVPETLDELTDLLRFIRDNDVNGNGDKNDEIPLSFRNNWLRQTISMVAKAFMPYVMTTTYFGLSLDDNKVVTEQYKDPNFREALKYMAGWYREKLIMPESFTLTRDQQIALTEGKDPVCGVVVMDHISNFTGGTGERRIDYNILPVLAGPKGVRTGYNRDPWGVVRMGMFVTDKCKDPELAIALYDYMLRMDVFLDQYIGPKSIGWDDPDPGSKSLSGDTPLYKYLITWRSPAMEVNTTWNTYGSFPQTKEIRLGEQAKDFDTVKRWIETGDPSLRSSVLTNGSYAEAHNYLSVLDHIPHWIPQKNFIPPIAMESSDTTRVADINTALDTYINQSLVEFITGAKDINDDSAWNIYLTELDRVGSKELASIYQKYIK